MKNKIFSQTPHEFLFTHHNLLHKAFKNMAAIRLAWMLPSNDEYILLFNSFIRFIVDINFNVRNFQSTKRYITGVNVEFKIG